MERLGWGLIALVLASACDGPAAGTDAGAPGVDAGEEGTPIPLGASTSAVIGPEGGTLATADGRLTLTFPPGALAGEETITITDVADTSAWVLEPEGLTFAVPVEARTRAVAPVNVALSFAASGAASTWPVRVEPGRVVAELGHFSLYALYTSEFEVVEIADPTPPEGAHLPIGPLVGLTTRARRTSLTTIEAAVEGDGVDFVLGGHADIRSVRLGHLTRSVSGPLTFAGDAGDLPLDVALDSPGATDEHVVVVTCSAPGEGILGVELYATFRAVFTDTRRLDRVDGQWRWTPIPTVELDALGEIHTSRDHPYVCDPGSPIIEGVSGTDPGAGDSITALDKPVDDGACTLLSDLSSCLAPRPEEVIARTLDPRLTLSDAAAARIFGEVFPCGDGPVGRTVCASTDPPPPGEWVLLQNTMGADVPLADPRGIYQHAFVFDANGDPSDGWTPLPEYPGDYFAGTDLWYELTYAPGAGWAVRVRDVRRGLADVPSHARFVIAGPFIGFLVPRAELDGAAPTFRTTAFRHEGDYGLTGGPWSADLYPPLAAPLLPIAGPEGAIDVAE